MHTNLHHLCSMITDRVTFIPWILYLELQMELRTIILPINMHWKNGEFNPSLITSINWLVKLCWEIANNAITTTTGNPRTKGKSLFKPQIMFLYPSWIFSLHIFCILCCSSCCAIVHCAQCVRVKVAIETLTFAFMMLIICVEFSCFCHLFLLFFYKQHSLHCWVTIAVVSRFSSPSSWQK